MNIIDYNKILDRYNASECYCSNGMTEMCTEEGIVCCKCGFVCDKIYKSYCEESDEKVISVSLYKDDMEGLLSDALKLGSVTSDINMSKRMKFMSYNYQDTVIFKTKKFIEEQSSSLGLSRGIVLLALSYFKKIVGNSSKEKGNIFKGVNKRAIIAACIYISCRENSKYIIERDLCKKLEISLEIFEEYLHMVIKQVNISFNHNSNDTLLSIIDRSKLPQKLRPVCLKIHNAVEKLGYMNNISYHNKVISIVGFVLLETKTTFDKEHFELVHNIKWGQLSRHLRIIEKYKKEIFTYIKNN